MEKAYLPGNLRERLTDLMAGHQMTRKKLAETIGLDPSNLNRFLSGQTENFSNESLIRAARLFDVSTDFLLGLSDTPDRRQYDIKELGLSAQAARNLYLGRADKRVVSLLLESPDFAMATQQIANFISASLAAGFAAQNELVDCLADLMPGRNLQEARQKVRATKRPVYQQDLSGIQANFMRAVKAMKKDMELEVQAQAMTRQQFRKMLERTDMDDEGKPKGIPPEAFADQITNIASAADTFSPQTLELLNQATLAMGRELQGENHVHK